MYKEDYLLKQINQFGEALSRLISKILGLKASINTEETFIHINEIINKELGLNIEILNIENSENFIGKLQNIEGFNIDNIEKTADLLFVLSQKIDNIEIKLKYLNLSLDIYNYINLNSDTFSFERSLKIDNIKNSPLIF